MFYEEFVPTEELGIPSVDCLQVRDMVALRNLRAQIFDCCCATCQLSQISYSPNGHIIEGHLCLIMLGCSPTINSCPLQPLVGWQLREKLTLIIESIPSSEDFERKSSVRKNPNPTPKTQRKSSVRKNPNPTPKTQSD